MKVLNDKSIKFLEEYLNNASPTGYESTGQKIWMKYLKPYVRYADLYSYSHEQQKEIINKYLNKEDIRRLERIYPNYRWLCI